VLIAWLVIRLLWDYVHPLLILGQSDVFPKLIPQDLPSRGVQTREILLRTTPIHEDIVRAIDANDPTVEVSLPYDCSFSRNTLERTATPFSAFSENGIAVA
jgi:hypothetical protein